MLLPPPHRLRLSAQTVAVISGELLGTREYVLQVSNLSQQSGAIGIWQMI